MKVLIIEDDADVTTLMIEILSQEGFTPLAAADGLEGLLKLTTRQADAALLDIMMPDLDGVRVLQQLLEEGDGELPLPIIVITGSPEGAATARKLIGADNVYEKPFDPTRLIGRLRAVLRTTGDADG
jgi:DNA-binding response OmpR family regulator